MSNDRGPGARKRDRAETTGSEGASSAPPAQRPRSTAPSSGVDPKGWCIPSRPFLETIDFLSRLDPSALPQADLLTLIHTMALGLDRAIRSNEASSFGAAAPAISTLVQNMTGFFLNDIEEMLGHLGILLHYKHDLPPLYGGDASPPATTAPQLAPPDAVPTTSTAPPRPKAPPRPARSPRRPPPKASYAKVAGPTPSTPKIPSKTATYSKVGTKQGTKSNVAIIRPSTGSSTGPSPSLKDFVDSRPLGDCLPLSYSVSLRVDWILRFQAPLTQDDHNSLLVALSNLYSSSGTDQHCPTSSSLKFIHVPTHHPDGHDVSAANLLSAIRSHPRWNNVHFLQPPRFASPPDCPPRLSGLVFCEIQDT